LPKSLRRTTNVGEEGTSRRRLSRNCPPRGCGGREDSGVSRQIRCDRCGRAARARGGKDWRPQSLGTSRSKPSRRRCGSRQQQPAPSSPVGAPIGRRYEGSRPVGDSANLAALRICRRLRRCIGDEFPASSLSRGARVFLRIGSWSRNRQRCHCKLRGAPSWVHVRGAKAGGAPPLKGSPKPELVGIRGAGVDSLTDTINRGGLLPKAH
jgi:hypothetical protein